MKKILLTNILALICSVGAVAQTDVTDFFLKNAGFDTNFDYTAKQSTAVAQEILPIDGWTAGFTIDYTITGVYEFGFKGTFNNGTIPAKGFNGEAGGGLALSTGWNQSFPYYQTVTLPAGTYTVTAPTYNGFTATAGTSLLAWIPEKGTQVKSTVSSYPSNKWIEDKIEFTLTETTTGKIQIGYIASGNGGSSNSANIVIDYVQIIGTNMSITVEELEAQLKQEALDNLKALIDKANELPKKPCSTAALDELTKVVESASAINDTNTKEEIAEASAAIQEALDAVNASMKEHQVVADAIDKAINAYDETKAGAEDLKTAIDAASTVWTNGDATSEEMKAAVEALDKATFAFNLANSTQGTGTAPSVTKTNHYVPTGATEALMRATFAGSNLIEKGVCWSTEHEPTVLDNRTTKAFTLNGTIIHVKGLEPATVYYLRPYAMNKTYQVAYGEEVKIVTHPAGTCVGTWDEGAPNDAANKRCREAIQQTIEYFNEWTGIKGFTLSGHYGAQTPTADCSYGGWMRIGPNTGNQAIGTVIHETGHGVGVGTSDRWWDSNVHSWKWFGREANEMYSFLEGKTADPYNSEFCMVGDNTHGWGSSATYDWFVNGADKDKHTELQYLGGCCLLYGLFIDGLCPTSAYSNGLPGYTYNFDDTKKYYLMCKGEGFGFGEGLLYQRGATGASWNKFLTSGEPIDDSAAWYLEFNPKTGYYFFKNAESGKYLTHAAGNTSMGVKTIASGKSPSATEQFQLMPDRTNVTLGAGKESITTHGYWMTWNDGGNKAMGAKSYFNVSGYGQTQQAAFDYSDKATSQMWIIISEDELPAYQEIITGIKPISLNESSANGSNVVDIVGMDGVKKQQTQKGFNIIKYSDGSTKKIFVK